ncbi:TolC family protein [Puteibacter caeruleilacunae]|nr:TolC family protein [Puteibacter caeruleilacunae]
MRKQKIIYNITALIALVFLFQSCLVTRKYKQPMVGIEDEYRNVSTTDSTTLASMPWEELFADQQLKVLIKEALGSNMDLLMAVERVKAAQAYYRQGRMGILPSLNISANGGHYESSDNGQAGVSAGGNGPNFENYQLTGSISWEADIWGKIRSTKRAALATYLQSEASQRAVESALIANLATTYYQLLTLDAQIDVAKRTVVNRKESLETMKRLKEAGQVTEAAVKQTEAQLYGTEILLVDLEKNAKLVENTMLLMLGRSLGTIERGTLDGQDIDISLSTGYPVQLLRNRPDVIASELGLKNAFELTNVAKSNFYPSISITANGGFESMDFDDWFNTHSLFSNFVGNLAQPLFNKRAIRTQYEVAKAQQEEAKYNFKKSVLNAVREVSDALANFEAEKSKYKLRENELEVLQKAEEYSEELLNNGYQNTTYLEVLTARSSVLSSEINMLDSKYQQLKSIVDLYLALGGGWQNK